MLCDSVRDAIALQTTNLNYGLQPMAGDSVKMHVLMDHYNCLQLTLEECHAVTPNGIRIQISAAQEGQTLTLSKDMTEMKGNATFSVFITTELFKPPLTERQQHKNTRHVFLFCALPTPFTSIQMKN